MKKLYTVTHNGIDPVVYSIDQLESVLQTIENQINFLEPGQKVKIEIGIIKVSKNLSLKPCEFDQSKYKSKITEKALLKAFNNLVDINL